MKETLKKLKKWWFYFALYFDCDRCGRPIAVKKAIEVKGDFFLCERCAKVAEFDRDVPVL